MGGVPKFVPNFARNFLISSIKKFLEKFVLCQKSQGATILAWIVVSGDYSGPNSRLKVTDLNSRLKGDSIQINPCFVENKWFLVDLSGLGSLASLTLMNLGLRDPTIQG